MPAGSLKTISDCPKSGDDIAGSVHAIGSAVTEFHIGDHVAALHQLGAPGGSFAEYALAWDWTTFHLGKDTNFEQAATVPMAALMAAIGLFAMLKVTNGPWAPAANQTPLVIYGAAGAVGAFAIKLANLVDVHPLICVAGKGIPFVVSLIDPNKSDVVIDYRKGNEALMKEMRDALQGQKLEYAFDATSEMGSFLNICQVLDESTGKITLVLPEYRKEIPASIEQSTTVAGSLWDGFRRNEALGNLGLDLGGKDFGLVMSTLIGRWLQEGQLKPHPYVVMGGGLRGLEKALQNLRAGRASAMKYVIRIRETPIVDAV